MIVDIHVAKLWALFQDQLQVLPTGIFPMNSGFGSPDRCYGSAEHLERCSEEYGDSFILMDGGVP